MECDMACCAWPTFPQGKAENQANQRGSEPAKPSLPPEPPQAAPNHKMSHQPLQNSSTEWGGWWLAEG